MTFTMLISLAAAAAALSAAALVLWRSPKALAHWLFLLGMLLFAAEAILVAMAGQAALAQHAASGSRQVSDTVEDLVRTSTLALALLPGTWLAFAVVYSRADYQRFLRRWRWVIAVIVLLPVIIWVADNFGEYNPMHRPVPSSDSRGSGVGGSWRLEVADPDRGPVLGGRNDVVRTPGGLIVAGETHSAEGEVAAVESVSEEQEKLRGSLKLTPGGAGLVIRYSAHQRLLHVFLLVGSVLVLMNLERTFRASVGTMRWRVKLVLLGLVMLFVVRLYTSTDVVVLDGTSRFAVALHPGALLIASGLILVSLLRARVFEIEVYPSRTFLERSLVVLLAGVYLLIVAFVALIIPRFALPPHTVLPMIALGVLAALVLLTLLLLSDRLRQSLSRFVSRHLRRPRYDYRQVWRTFTERTARCVGRGEFCEAVVRWASETFDTLSVSLWLIDASRGRVELGASTVMNPADGRSAEPVRPDVPRLAALLQDQAAPFDLEWMADDVVPDLRLLNHDQFGKGGGRFMVPLLAGHDLLGVLALGDRVSGASFTVEDIELLKSASDHSANHLLGIQLSQRLMETREMEAFQTMSTFFVHDLKNVASTLSLTLKNLPIHFDNPEFRADALKAVGRCVERMNELIGCLGELRRGLTLQLTEYDLDAIARATLGTIDPASRDRVRFEPGNPPAVRLDASQLQRVLFNLIVNALEASGDDGVVRVATGALESWVWIEVSDSGCGMTPEFLEKHLFRPFQTTKKRGIGIGAYQSRMIVEAHRGRIDVQSKLGQGSGFRVLLPRTVES